MLAIISAVRTGGVLNGQAVGGDERNLDVTDLVYVHHT
jgi:hypothetical protein